jgi:SWI/SNF-related matrix-associated actin-dependent regulator 1 of chromatin subfamily A
MSFSQKPFATLDEVRQVSSEISRTAAAGSKKLAKKAIGDKIVDKCLEMWTGYEAVDELVTRCEALGNQLQKR